MENQVKGYRKDIATKNKRGEYVPAIPCPYYGIKNRCECGKKFWTVKGYEEHYALEHILGM